MQVFAMSCREFRTRWPTFKRLVIAVLLLAVLPSDAAMSDVDDAECDRETRLEFNVDYLLPPNPKVVVFSASDAAAARETVDHMTQTIKEVLPSPEFRFSTGDQMGAPLSPDLYKTFDVVVVMDSEFQFRDSVKYSAMTFDDPRIRAKQRVILSLSDADQAKAPVSRKAFIQISEEVAIQKQWLLLELSLALAAVPELNAQLNYSAYVSELLKAPIIEDRVWAARARIIGACAGPIVGRVYSKVRSKKWGQSAFPDDLPG